VLCTYISHFNHTYYLVVLWIVFTLTTSSKFFSPPLSAGVNLLNTVQATQDCFLGRCVCIICIFINVIIIHCWRCWLYKQLVRAIFLLPVLNEILFVRRCDKYPVDYCCHNEVPPPASSSSSRRVTLADLYEIVLSLAVGDVYSVPIRLALPVWIPVSSVLHSSFGFIWSRLRLGAVPSY
jgi:hypothetical protein